MTSQINKTASACFPPEKVAKTARCI